MHCQRRPELMAIIQFNHDHRAIQDPAILYWFVAFPSYHNFGSIADLRYLKLHHLLTHEYNPK